jgi:tRNA (guanine37-N1)-methyltransferase
VRIDIITVLPELLEGPFAHSILKRAKDKGLAEVHVHQLRDFGAGKHQQVDDYQYGGGAGMVMQCEPLVECIEALQKERNYDAVLYMTPDGKRFNQQDANALSLLGDMIIICGHYKGIDQRVRDHWITHEYSIGDYFLTTKLQRLRIVFKTICWPLRYIRGQKTFVAIKSPKYCSVAIQKPSIYGEKNRRINALKRVVQIC